MKRLDESITTELIQLAKENNKSFHEIFDLAAIYICDDPAKIIKKVKKKLLDKCAE